MDDEKEKRRKKQYKRMGKILESVWALDVSTNYFQERPPEFKEYSKSYVLCLSDIGSKIDSKAYRLGRQGWEDFAKDLGGVYNFHIKVRKAKSATAAKKSLDIVRDLLQSIETSLVKCASDHVPIAANVALGIGAKAKDERNEHNLGNIKKRKSSEAAAAPNQSHSNAKIDTKKIRHSNKNSELAERETRAMELLFAFIEDLGGNRDAAAGFRSRVTKKIGALNKHKFDVVYYNESDRRFRSMQEVGRFLKLVKDTGSNRPSGIVRNRSGALGISTSKDIDNEKKRIRKDLERLRKAHNRVSKNLDDFATNRTEISYPIDDTLLQDDCEFTNTTEKYESKSKNQCNRIVCSVSEQLNGKTQIQPQKIARETCAAAYEPDLIGFQNIGSDYIPDLLMSWDFMCTFERVLSLSPISLDDFAAALVYSPPNGQTGDDCLSPPIFIAEAHLALLKLLLQDRSSDDWWWSTLESADTEQENYADIDEVDLVDTVGDDRPICKIDVEAMLAQVEDPVATIAWLRALEYVDQANSDWKSIKTAIKAALKLVYNKWVSAYLRKTLGMYKIQGTKVAAKAIQWLVRFFMEARPDIAGDRTIHKETISKAKNRATEKALKQIGTLPVTAPVISEDDAISDFEDDDDSDDESDEEDIVKPGKSCMEDSQVETDKVASSIPPKPSPTIVDLLLPPTKPKHNSDLVDSFTWPHIVGAVAARYLHRKKRVLNEVDDSIRAAHFLPPLFTLERREREKVSVSRVLTECYDTSNCPTQLEEAVHHLCTGGHYLELSGVARLCILRVLIEAANDTGTIHECVIGKYKQRTNATKSLEMEQRRAKKELKEKTTADEVAARARLASDAREKFIDEKRDEIRVLNSKSKEFDDDVIESFTEEDIIDFDDDIKADFEALPGPEAFNKMEVTRMIQKMQEMAAFDTDSLRVLTLAELEEREKIELEEMEGQLTGFGGDDALHDGVDRETRRSIERLLRDIEKARALDSKLPGVRRAVIEQLSDALENGTTTVLRNAFIAAKKAKLSGIDDETGGIWVVNLMRDVALELENAKQNKRLLDAQRDLIGKLSKCFIRTEPIGNDRFGNRFWSLDNDDSDHVWRETEMIAVDDINGFIDRQRQGFVNLFRDAATLTIGAEDMEQDFVFSDPPYSEKTFRHFSRQEYHSSGIIPSLARSSWGCYTTVDSLRAVMKQLDSRGIHEEQLKNRLKETIEQSAMHCDKSENAESLEDDEGQINDVDGESKHAYKTNGDEDVFEETLRIFGANDESLKNTHKTGIEMVVRIRVVINESKSIVTARYVNGVVTGWKMNRDPKQKDSLEDDESFALTTGKEVQEIPVWRVQTVNGRIHWLRGDELLQSEARWQKWKGGCGYFENDSSFLAYRNNLGRFCGKAVDAPYSSSPSYFAKAMLRKESELYPKLKARSHDNSWGGQSGARALWTNSMKDYAYDFPTVRQGLLTLETAFFELTGQFSEYPNASNDDSVDGDKLLNDGTSSYEIELESLEKGLPGLWNSPSSRAVYIAIINLSNTTGMLALALDLLVRNTVQYLLTHKLVNSRNSRSFGVPEPNTNDDVQKTSKMRRPLRSSRRMNAWQQKQQDEDEDADGNDNDSDEDWR